MILGIISDSHDNVEKIKQAALVFKEQGVQVIIHAGDVIAPTSLKPLMDLAIPIYAVRGNNDGETIMLHRLITSTKGQFFTGTGFIKIEGFRIGLFHEHELPLELKNGTPLDLVIWGHNHELYVEHGKPCRINPGEACGLMTGRATIVVVRGEDGELQPPDVFELK